LSSRIPADAAGRSAAVETVITITVTAASTAEASTAPATTTGPTTTGADDDHDHGGRIRTRSLGGCDKFMWCGTE